MRNKVQRLSKGQPFAIAVSGGPDSMALAHMLRDMPATRVMTVDHGLRPESPQEASFVQQQMSAWGLPCDVLAWEGEKPSANIQASARTARYSLMADQCAARGVQVLLLAHHKDDQAETVLMRLERGSGVDGLAAMPELACRGQLALLRPLLDVSKQDLLSYVDLHHIPYVTDPSNAKARYKRVQMRQLFDQLEDRDLLVARLAKTALHMQEAQAALSFLVDIAQRQCVVYPFAGCCAVDIETLLGFPRSTQLSLLAKLVKYYGRQNYNPRADALDALVQRVLLPEFISQPLAGAMIVKTDRLWIGREAAAMPVVATESAQATYDAHWQINAECAQQGCQIAPLGELGWQQLCATGGEDAFRTLPHLLRHALPAVFDQEKLLQVLPQDSWHGLCDQAD